MKRALSPLVLGAALLVAPAHAQESSPAHDSPVQVRVGEVPVLSPGSHAEVIVEVRVDASARGPLLVTPSVDGVAIEVVRGRLFRFDAEDPSADPLRFRVPISAMSIGTAVLLVRVDGHACEGARCTPIEAEARRAIEVR